MAKRETGDLVVRQIPAEHLKILGELAKRMNEKRKNQGQRIGKETIVRGLIAKLVGRVAEPA